MAKDLFPSPHPLTSPHSEEDLVDRLRLLRSRRVGPATFTRLINEHRTAAAALAALPDIAAAAGVKNYEICPLGVATAELKAGKLAGAVLLDKRQTGYPPQLAALDDAPPLIWALGNLELLHKPIIAIVGARNASSLGTRMARQLASDLGKKGMVVISGLARGIDTAAHLGSLDTGTIAVMAGGVDVVYPAENASLAQEIAENGLRLSEQPPGLQPRPQQFPQRNRIISGVASAVIVVEAAARSGSLITARNALDQGRDVMAVPGHPFDGRTTGSNMLIRDGATLVRNADDVIEALTNEAEPEESARADARADPPAISLTEASALHTRILNQLGPSPIGVDQLVRDLGLPSDQVAPELVALELEGKITRQAGGLVGLSV